MTLEQQLEHLKAWVGEWETEATHPMLPDTLIRGRITVEWLEGEKFLLHRARNDHPDVPDSISVIGETEEGAGSLTRLCDIEFCVNFGRVHPTVAQQDACDFDPVALSEARGGIMAEPVRTPEGLRLVD